MRKRRTTRLPADYHSSQIVRRVAKSRLVCLCTGMIEQQKRSLSNWTTMTQVPPQISKGEELQPAIGKLWGMLVLSLLLIPACVVIVFCWWFEVALPGGKVLTPAAGVIALLGIPLGGFLVLMAAAMLVTAKRLIIGDDRVQMVSGGRVVVNIPFENIAEIYATGEDPAGTIGLKLRNRHDPATLVPSWTKESYEIQLFGYRQPLQSLHAKLSERMAKFQASR